MTEWKMKRFWKEATVDARADGFAVVLDGRGVKTPAKSDLIVPTQALAEAVAAEWNAQQEEVNPLSMPATRMANAAIDRVTRQHGEVAEMLASYADSDLLCYRAEHPQALVDRQTAQWDPLLDWADRELGARLQLRTGVMHQPQSPDALRNLSERTHALDAFELSAFHDLVSLSGSLILGFATSLGKDSAERLWEVSRLDEIWQSEQWGIDEEAEAMAAVKRADFLHAARMFTLCRTG